MAGTDDVEQLIEARLRRIEEELAPVTALLEERERLRRALGALSASGQAGPRAMRGANLQSIVAFVTANPGRRAGEISGATGIARAVVYSAVARLVQAGRLRRETTPEGGVVYFPPEP